MLLHATLSPLRLGKANCHMKAKGVHLGGSNFPTSLSPKLGARSLLRSDQLREKVYEMKEKKHLAFPSSLLKISQIWDFLNSATLGDTEILKGDRVYCEILQRHNPSNSGLWSSLSDLGHQTERIKKREHSFCVDTWTVKHLPQDRNQSDNSPSSFPTWTSQY